MWGTRQSARAISPAFVEITPIIVQSRSDENSKIDDILVFQCVLHSGDPDGDSTSGRLNNGFNEPLNGGLGVSARGGAFGLASCEVMSLPHNLRTPRIQYLSRTPGKQT